MKPFKSYMNLIYKVHKFHGDNTEDVKWHDMEIVKEDQKKKEYLLFSGLKNGFPYMKFWSILTKN